MDGRSRAQDEPPLEPLELSGPSERDGRMSDDLPDPARDIDEPVADEPVLAAVRLALCLPKPIAGAAREGSDFGCVEATVVIAVAFSGGLDSAVLLDAVCAVVGPSNCIALHIHHGLSVHADAWLDHARHVAQRSGAGFLARRVDLGDCAGQGVEAAARGARYAALFELCDTAGAAALVLGHHADDQAETFLLQALRGAGLRGLSAMPAETRDRHAGLRLLRPLLSLPRSALLAYAQRHGLQWIDDESNDDPRFARNALRHRVLPSLGEYFPAYREGLARSARHAAQAQGLLDEVAVLDLQAVVVRGADANEGESRDAGEALNEGKDPDEDRSLGVGEDPHEEGAPRALSLAALRALDSKSPPRAVNLLRYWMRGEGLHAMSTARLENLLDKLRRLAGDRSLNFMHATHVLRHYRGVLSWELAAPAGHVVPEVAPAVQISTSPLAPAPTAVLTRTQAPAPAWALDATSTPESTSSTPSIPLSVSLWGPRSAWGADMLDDTTRRAPVSLDWSGEEVWYLAAWRGSLVFAPTQADDPQRVAATLLRSAPLVARARAGGERLRRVAGGSSRSLKNIFQQAGVPAWRRDVPLIFCGEQLIFVPGIGIDSAAQPTSQPPSTDARETWRRIEWRPDTVLA
jgi:tRNA(Ile)-lysidine synthase